MNLSLEIKQIILSSVTILIFIESIHQLKIGKVVFILNYIIIIINYNPKWKEYFTGN